jgi:hypothetical protein
MHMHTHNPGITCAWQRQVRLACVVRDGVPKRQQRKGIEVESWISNFARRPNTGRSQAPNHLEHRSVAPRPRPVVLARQRSGSSERESCASTCVRRVRYFGVSGLGFLVACRFIHAHGVSFCLSLMLRCVSLLVCVCVCVFPCVCVQKDLHIVLDGARVHWKFVLEIADMNYDNKISHTEVTYVMCQSNMHAHSCTRVHGWVTHEDRLIALHSLIPLSYRALSWAGVARMQASASLVGLMPMTIPS